MAEGVGRIKQEVAGIAAVLFSIYLGIALFSYSKWDPSPFTFTHMPAKNYGGIAGAYISDIFMSFIGLTSYTVPFFLLIFGVKKTMGKEGQKENLPGTLLFLFSSSLMLSLLMSTFGFPLSDDPGGLIGKQVTVFLREYISLPGSYIFSLSAFFSSLVLLIPASLTGLKIKMKPSEAVIPEPKPENRILIEDIIVPTADEEEPVELLPRPPLPEKEMYQPPQVKKARPAQSPATKDGYSLPPVDLLKVYDISTRSSDDDIRTFSSMIKGKLADFGVDGNVTRAEQGPVVTMHEFEPAPGVKINRVVSLSDDLALSLKAQSLRVSPIAGKNTIGIEVPNRKREIVSLREIISSDNFEKSHSMLSLALGKDIYGNPVVADLAKMPHLLVAGATGAGKSVSINSMVMSILYKASPKEVKMLMIDPKLLELSMYEDIPHLISPVITNPKKAAEALRKMVFEMERRYRLLAERGSRNIDTFNSQASPEEKLPYIIVFIDELADLMFASSNEVEDSITRLAQMARAAGIHLIIATQRPSVDVITGLIKANFPARISFQVFSKIDSRTILDSQGAEQLLGKGDMLLMLPGSRIMRVHGALVTEAEITATTEFVKSQGTPDFTIFEEIPVEEPAAAEDTAEKDEMFDKALEFAESVGEVSISSIQRRFKIGYNRAARIMEIMEEEGLVGPPKAAGKPRDFIGRRS